MPATTRWESGLRFVTTHPKGSTITTDMPVQLGGGGREPSPGWFFRAGLASCAATTIAMEAAAQGIELTTLEVAAHSRSDSRGFLGVPDELGSPVFAGPHEVSLHVRIAAAGASPDTLRQMVERSQERSPIPSAVRSAVPVVLKVDVVPA
ncbi:MAG: OsmC family protein [Vicinamibacterales bacterium]